MNTTHSPQVSQVQAPLKLAYSVIQVLFPLAVLAVGCSPETAIRAEQMPTRILAAIEEGRSGITIMMSRASIATMSSKELRMAAAYVKSNPDVSSYHLLMALRKQAPQAYQDIPDMTKAEVLCDALAKVGFLNDFGHLDGLEGYNYSSAQALVSLGTVAVPRLRELLWDRRRVLLLGSADATASYVHKYRRCDFAYRYIMFIIGRKPTFADDLGVRDKLIADLEEALKSGNMGDHLGEHLEKRGARDPRDGVVWE